MAKSAKSTKKAAKVLPFCACGCGKRTKGGTFLQGHDQRLRGMLKRGETLKAATLAFLKEQNKTSEWMKLRLAGPAKAKKAKPVRKASTRARTKAKLAAPQAPAQPTEG